MNGGAYMLLMALVMYIGLNLMSMMYTLTMYLLTKSSQSLNNILLSAATLPLPACIPYHPTLLPYGGTPLSRISAKLSEFERILNICAVSGVWVLSEAVILLRKDKVIYYDNQSVCQGKSQFNPFSQKVKPFHVKIVQKLDKIHQNSVNRICFARFSCVRTTYKRTSQLLP